MQMEKGNNKMNDCIIKTRQLQKYYNNKLAIDNLDIDISTNSITGLIGKNGSGKTTLMKLLAGQLDVTSGEIHVFCEPPMDNLKVLKNLIYTVHNYDYAKGLNLLSIISDYKQMFDSFDMEFATKLLKYFELKPTLKYHHLSQGMASVFNFICALSCRTKLTMFDEPILGMDVSVRKAVYEILLRDYTEHPRTIIISSHLISEIEGIISDIIFLDNGKLVIQDSIENIRESVYRVDGTKNNLDHFLEGKDVIYTKTGAMSNYAILRGSITDLIVNESKRLYLDLSQVRVEDLFFYLTKQYKEEELECLWETKK